MSIIVTDEVVYDPGGFLLDSVRYHPDVMATLKSQDPDVSLIWQTDTSWVSFTICQQCHGDIDGDVTPISLQYQNVHWGVVARRYHSYQHNYQL